MTPKSTTIPRPAKAAQNWLAGPCAGHDSPFQSLQSFVLASASPRRHDFLRGMGLSFESLRPKGAEPPPLPDESPAAYAMRAAQAKALAVAALRPTLPVLGADTLVALGNKILGKPKDERDALHILLQLTGKTHEVISACHLQLANGDSRQFFGVALVHFAPWPESVLRAYAACGEAADKAGAYALQGQGAFLVERIEGSASAVIGLPVAQLGALLLELGIIAPRKVQT